MDILALLEQGSTPDEITENFKKSLAEAVAKREKEKTTNAKKEALTKIMRDVVDYFNTYYDTNIELDEDDSLDDMLEVFDSFGRCLKTCDPFELFKGLL